MHYFCLHVCVRNVRVGLENRKYNFSTHWFPVHLVFFFDNFSVDPTDIIVRIVILAIAIVAVAARTATFCTRFIV